MRVLLQRVRSAEVAVDGERVAEIGRGLLVLAGIGSADGEAEIAWMAAKVAALRIFPDELQRMNRSVIEVGGEALVVSQFTLYADCRQGKRPSFTGAASGEGAELLIARFAELLREAGVRNVACGRFGASMDVSLVNEGPVTIWIEREGVESAS